MTPPTIMFDLDGTLADTAPDLYGSVCWLLNREGRRRAPYDSIKTAIGDGAGPMIRAGFGYAGEAPDGAEHERLIDLFLDHYAGRLADLSEPFVGVLDAIRRLKARGALIGICTNKRLALAERQLAVWRIRHLFDAVKGGDSFPWRKPDARHLLGAIAAAGGDPANAVMIGDTVSDTGAAANAGTPAIAVSFGYAPTPAETLGAARVIDHFGQLDRALEGLVRWP